MKIKTLQKLISSFPLFYYALPLLPVLIFYFGIGLNAIVMGLNHAQMPVLWPTGCGDFPKDSLHSCMTPATHLKFMADWIVLRDGEHFSVASIGDLFLWLGEALRTPLLWAWITLILKDSWNAANRNRKGRVSKEMARGKG